MTIDFDFDFDIERRPAPRSARRAKRALPPAAILPPPKRPNATTSDQHPQSEVEVEVEVDLYAAAFTR